MPGGVSTKRSHSPSFKGLSEADGGPEHGWNGVRSRSGSRDATDVGVREFVSTYPDT